MAKVISFTLDAASVGQAVSELKKYRTEFEEKCRQFREAVAERIRWSAESGFNSAVADYTIRRLPANRAERSQAMAPIMASNIRVTVVPGDKCSMVRAEGKDVLFIEYGAGVHFNGSPGDSPNPWGVQQGYVIGAYPGNGTPPSKGVNERWEFYENGKGTDRIVTLGTPAAMPMYRGAEEAIRAIDEIAREVFG